MSVFTTPSALPANPASVVGPTARPDAYVASLTGIRAVASGMVVLFHYLLAAKALRAADLPALSWLFGNGQTGVSIFFALSGFLITLRYRDSFARGTVRFRDYWLKRLIRIYPVYVFTLTFGAIVPALLEGSQDYANPLTWIGLYGMGQALTFSIFALGIPVGWSLTIEEIFYLLAPRLGRWLDRKRGGIALVVGTGAIIALVSASVFALTLLLPVGPSGEALGPWVSKMPLDLFFSTSFFARIPEFVSGMVGAILLLRFRTSVVPRARALVVGGTAAAVLFMFAQNEALGQGHYFLYALLRFLSATGGAALMLGLASAPPNTAIARFLSLPLMDYLGKTSYALYLVHVSIPIQRIWSGLVSLPIHPLFSVPIIYVIAVGASILLYELVEHPVHSWLSKRLR
ncbi:MAG: acyltransferase [Thermoflexales bacterium]